MSLPWNISLEDAPEFRRKPTPPQVSLVKHYCNLDIHDPACEEVSTGLMCDIGFENKEPQTIQKLIGAGMTIARAKVQGLEPDECAQIIQSIRQAVYAYSADLRFVYPLAVCIDIKGPDLVTGNLKGGLKSTLELNEGCSIRLTKDISWQNSGTVDCLYVSFENLNDLSPKDIIWIDSLTEEKIKLFVSDVGDDSLDCIIIIGGRIGPKMAVRVSQGPQDKSSTDSATFDNPEVVIFDKLENKVSWAVAADIDALLIPNAQSKDDVKFFRDLLADRGRHLLVFACIETMQALDNFDEILATSDGVYIDRNILCISVPIEKVFIAIKIMTAKCNVAGKPCIIKAVINEHVPTLCVTDTANLVLDGADVLALEIYYDSPLKKLSVDAVQMAEICIGAAVVICKQAESIIWQPQIYGNIELMQRQVEEPTKAVCISAIELAMRSNSAVIIVITNSGRTAIQLAQVRPPCPVVAVTRQCHVARQLRFWRSIKPVHYTELPKDKWSNEVEARIQVALEYCKLKQFVRAGDPFVILAPTRHGVGYCDAVRLLYATSKDTVVLDVDPDSFCSETKSRGHAISRQ